MVAANCTITFIALFQVNENVLADKFVALRANTFMLTNWRTKLTRFFFVDFNSRLSSMKVKIRTQKCVAFCWLMKWCAGKCSSVDDNENVSLIWTYFIVAVAIRRVVVIVTKHRLIQWWSIGKSPFLNYYSLGSLFDLSSSQHQVVTMVSVDIRLY